MTCALIYFFSIVFIFWRGDGNFRLVKAKESFARRKIFSRLTLTKMKPLIHFKIRPVAAALLIFAVTGCDRDKVKVYHVDATDAASPPPPAAAPGSMPATMPDGLAVPDNSGQPQLQYVLPAGWEKKVPSQMRVASFGISEDGKNADVSVIPLGGMAGNDPANVNRWRGQVGLGSLADADVARLAEKVAVGDQPADLYDLAGTNPANGAAERILGVILHRDDTAWFFKMTGDADLVEKQKSAFVSFLKSVQFSTAASATQTDMNPLPPSHPPIDGMNSVPTAGADVAGKPAWTIPVGWQEGPPVQFLIAKYIIAGADGASAAVNVSSLAGDGGGFLANVNRWRGQLGLPPFTEADLLPYENGINLIFSPYGIVDFTGIDSKTGKPARLVGAIVPQNGQTWFYKLMGDENVVAAQKDAFEKFIQSAKYPDAH
jgi:hypothetical protein